MVEFVCALEPEAVFLAAQKVDEEGLVKLEELMIACEEAMGLSSKNLVDMNYSFTPASENWQRIT